MGPLTQKAGNTGDFRGRVGDIRGKIRMKIKIITGLRRAFRQYKDSLQNGNGYEKTFCVDS